MNFRLTTPQKYTSPMHTFSGQAKAQQYAKQNIDEGPSWANIPLPNTFAELLFQYPADNPRVNLYGYPITSDKTWPFLSGSKIRGMVQGVPLVTFPGSDKEPVVRFLVTWRPPMGPEDDPRLSLELPGGGWEDDQTATDALHEEIAEELGYAESKITWPLKNPFAFAVSPGMTSQQIALGLVEIDGNKPAIPKLEAIEKRIILDRIDVPVRTFLAPALFTQWLSEMQIHYILPENILAVPTILKARLN